MRAIHIPTYLPPSTPYTTLRPTTLPTPGFGNPTSVLILITHTAINHVDLLYSRGLHQNNHAKLITPPFNLGLEFAGIVISAPRNSGFKTNDRVWGSGLGSHATHISVSPTALRHVPAGASLEDVAGIGAATAPVSYGALHLCAEMRRGETVLVHAAAGGLGVAAVQIAVAAGCRVVGTVGSEVKKRALEGELGASMLGVVRYDLEGWEGEVVKLVGNGGVDVVYDTVGLVEGSIRCCRFGGRVVVAGFAGRGGVMEKLSANRVLLKGVQLRGYRYGESGRRDKEHTRVCWEGVERLVNEGNLKPVVYRTYKGLESVGQAMQDLYERKVWGKALVQVQSEEGEEVKARL